MADWNLPILSSLYSEFLTLLKARDEDSITLGKNIITNIVTGTIRYERTANKFQEWDGAAWIDLVISQGSGGLGATTPAGGRTALGLGDIATQNANNVTITGGTISNLSSLGVNGNVDIGGTLELGSSNNVVSNAAGLLDATKLFGVVPPVNLGTGTRDGSKFLRDDGTWNDAMAYRHSQYVNDVVVYPPDIGGTQDITLSAGFTNAAKMFLVPAITLFNPSPSGGYLAWITFPNATTLRVNVPGVTSAGANVRITGMVLEVM